MRLIYVDMQHNYLACRGQKYATILNNNYNKNIMCMSDLGFT